VQVLKPGSLVPVGAPEQLQDVGAVFALRSPFNTIEVQVLKPRSLVPVGAQNDFDQQSRFFISYYNEPFQHHRGADVKTGVPGPRGGTRTASG